MNEFGLAERAATGKTLEVFYIFLFSDVGVPVARGWWWVSPFDFAGRGRFSSLRNFLVIKREAY